MFGRKAKTSLDTILREWTEAMAHGQSLPLAAADLRVWDRRQMIDAQPRKRRLGNEPVLLGGHVGQANARGASHQRRASCVSRR